MLMSANGTSSTGRPAVTHSFLLYCDIALASMSQTTCHCLKQNSHSTFLCSCAVLHPFPHVVLLAASQYGFAAFIVMFVHGV